MVESALGSVVGAEHVLTDPDLRAGAEVDWTGRWRGTASGGGPAGERRARSPRCCAVCAAAGVPVVPQGGNTGLVGGGVPAGVEGAVVLSTRRLAGLAPVDADGTVVAGAGATIAAVQAHAAAAGWQFGMDWAARDSATVGGAIATNAGGLRVLRWGPARAQLVGAEAALASGALLSRVDGPVKDSHRLRPVRAALRQRGHARGADPGAAAAGAAAAGRARGRGGRRAERSPRRGALLAARAARGCPDLAAAELIGDAALDLRRPAATRCPTAGPRTCWWRPSAARTSWPTALAERWASATPCSPTTPPTGPGCGATGRSITESISRAGVPVKLDVSVPADRLAEVWAALPAAVGPAGPSCSVTWPRANLHVNMLDVPADAEAAADRPGAAAGRRRRRVDQRRARDRPGQGARGCT